MPPESQQICVDAAGAHILETLPIGLGANEVVYFADAVHPEHQSRPAYGWIRRGDKLAVKRSTGHRRMNLHGALCLEDFDCQIVESDRISAETTLRLLQRATLGNASSTSSWTTRDTITRAT